MNGKLGDHPLNDILDHGVPVFSPGVDEIVRKLAALVPRYRLVEMFDWLNPPPLADFKPQLESKLHQLTEDATSRGWEVRQ